MFVMAAAWTANPGSKQAGLVLVAMAVCFQVPFLLGTSPVTLSAAGELPSTRLRAETFGLGNIIGFSASFLAQVPTPYYINPTKLNIGAQVGYIRGGSNLVMAILVWFCMPETRNRSVEDIDEMFYAKVPPREWKQYRCVRNTRD